MHLSDPKLLVQFVAIAEERSLTRAAERLLIAQPWLSTRMRRLEEELGFEVFSRTSQGLRLTDRGAEFLESAKAVAASLEAAQRAAIRIRNEDSQRLRLGAPPYCGQITQYGKLVDAYSTSYSGVSMEVHVGWTPALLHRLAHSELDLTFAIGKTSGTSENSIIIERLGLDVLLPTGHALAKSRELFPDQLRGIQIYAFSRNLHRDLFDELYTPLIDAGAVILEGNAHDNTFGKRAIPTDQAFISQIRRSGTRRHTRNYTRVAMANVSIPFLLVRRSEDLSPAAHSFWTLALSGQSNRVDELT